MKYYPGLDVLKINSELPGDIVEFKQDLFEEFRALFRLIWKKDYPLEVFRWRFGKNPFGSPIIRVCRKKNKLIGFYGVIPRILYVPKIGILNVMLSLDTITDPDYQGKGIFPALASNVYAEAFQKNYSLVFGFPNQNSRYSIGKKLNWLLQPIKFSFEYCLDTFNPAGEFNLNSKYSYTQISKFDDKIDQLWNKHKDDHPLTHTPRIKKYLDWRFTESPVIKYYSHYVFDSAKSVVGYFVLKEFRPGIWHIVDFYCESDRIFEFIFVSSIEISKNKGAQTLSLWNTQPEFSSILNRYQYRMMDLQTSFGYLLNPHANLDPVINEKNWSITMADSDVF